MESDELKPLISSYQKNHFLKSTKEPSLYWSVRFLFSVIMGLCYLVIYMQRTNMSFAIVCMVNSTAIVNSENLDSFAGTSLIENQHKNGYKDGKFVWFKSDQGLILSAYFYGYLLTQILGGWCALRFGGVLVIIVSTLVSSLVTMLITPVANLNSISAVFVLRFIIGLTHGFTFSALGFIFVKWAPADEKSSLVGFSIAGTYIGVVISMLFGSYLCEYGFLEGWGSIFILFGAFGIVMVLIIIGLTSESPTTHRFISIYEKNYIMERVPYLAIKKKIKTPWRAIMTSKACWAIFISNIGLDWGLYLFLTETPTYFKDVLRLDLQSNALFSSIPFLASFVANILGGIVSDQMINANLLSRTNCRKLFNAIGLIVPMVCTILLGFIIDHTNAILGVVLVTIAVGFMGLNFSAGFCVNTVDIGGQYTGVLFGISNTIGTIPGVVAPYLVGLMTPKGTKEEWRVIFVITALIYFVCTIPFMFMAKSETEKWAEDVPEPAPETNKNDIY